MYKQYNIKKIVSYFGFTLLNKKHFLIIAIRIYVFMDNSLYVLVIYLFLRVVHDCLQDFIPSS